MWWVIDGNNVMGAGADGWWNDRVGAAARLAQRIAEWSRTHGDPIVLVYDGRTEETVTQLAGGNLEILYSEKTGRDAADDRIVDLVEDRYDAEPEITVVTSDIGLADRLPPGVTVVGAGAYRRKVGLVGPGRRR